MRPGLLFSTVLATALAATSANAEEPTTVSVDFTELDATTFKQVDGVALERVVVVRLVQAGFAVVSSDRHPTIRLTFAKGDKGIVLHANGESISEEAHVERISTTPSETHLEVAHKAVELVRTVDASLPHSISPPPPTPAPAPAPPPNPNPNSSFAVDAGVGVLVRRGGIDPLVRLLGRGFVTPHWAIPLGISLVPASGSGIRVFEWQVEAGVSYGFGGSQWHFDVGPLFGLLVHSFALDGAGAGDGVRFNAVGSLSAMFTWRFSSNFHLGLEALGGLADAGRVHKLGVDAIWERGPTRFACSATVGMHW